MGERRVGRRAGTRQRSLPLAKLASGSDLTTQLASALAMLAALSQLVAPARAQGDVADVNCHPDSIAAIFQAADTGCPGWAQRECPVSCAMALAPLMVGECHNTIHQMADPADSTHELGRKIDGLWVACLRLDTEELRTALRAAESCADRPPAPPGRPPPPPPPPRGPPPPPPGCVDNDRRLMGATAGQGPTQQGWRCAEIRDIGACVQVVNLGWCGCSCPPPDPDAPCHDDDARLLAATPGQGPTEEGWTCGTIAEAQQCSAVQQLGWCECSCPIGGHRRERRLQTLEEQYEDNQNLLEAYIAHDGSVCDLAAPPPPPPYTEPPTCEDDPDFIDSIYGNECAPFALNQEFCDSFVDVRGRSAAEACPVSCRSGCLLTHDDCHSDNPAWNPCQNGGVCFDGVGSYGCRCLAGFCGTPDCSVRTEIPFDATGQCPCVDSPTYREQQYTGGLACDMFAPDDLGGRFNGLCHAGQDHNGVSPAVACPDACETGCAAAYDDCIDSPCLNGGVCTDAQGFAICTCPGHLASDVEGDTCTDECNPNPCLNGGVCTDGISDFTCQCTDGWAGPLCEDTACTDCRYFTGSELLTARLERDLVSFMPRSVAGRTWELCYSTLLHDDTDADEFHNRCDAYDVTVTLVQHGATPQTAVYEMAGQGVEHLSAGPAWEEGAEWLFGGVAFQSWSMEGCCSEAGNTCRTIQQHDPPFCFDNTHSETFLFRLAPGQPQQYGVNRALASSVDPVTGEKPQGWNHYRTVGPAWWPGFGFGADLSIGNGDSGHCDPVTFDGVQNEICGGHENWEHKVMEVWRIAE